MALPPRLMGADQYLDWHGAAASALAWWDEAGVDTLVGDDARDWLAPPAPTVAAPAVGAQTALPATALPDTLDAYLAWRSGADAPDAGWAGGSVCFEGPARAALMVLLDCPDRGDCAAGKLLDGAAGRLFDAMMAAIGLTRGAVHLAAICARRPSAGRIPTDRTEALVAIARHHIGLAAPKRLLIMGSATSRAVLGMDGVAARGILHNVNHGGGTVAAIVTHHPRFLLEKPAAKADAWRDLQSLGRELNA